MTTLIKKAISLVVAFSLVFGLTIFTKAEGEATIEITNVYQNITLSNDGSRLNFEASAYDEKGNAISGTASDFVFYYKKSTAANYSYKKATTFNNGVATLSGFSVSKNNVYLFYVKYGSVESEPISIGVTQANAPTLISVTPEINGGSNGTITIESEYSYFEYYKQATTALYTTEKTISGLSAGTYYVKAAASRTEGENDYDFLISSATVKQGTKSTITIEKETITTNYTIKFINAAGVEVSSNEYLEGTSASKVVIPENTETYSNGNIIYKYSWPQVTNVNDNATYYEIETTTEYQQTKIEILNVYQDLSYSADGTRISVVVGVFDEDGFPISPDSVEDNVVFYSNNTKYTSKKLNVEGTQTFSFTVKTDSEYTVYAEFLTSDDYYSSKSEAVTISAKKAQTPTLSSTSDVNEKSNGTITISSIHDEFIYYKESGKKITTSEKTIENLEAGTYYVYVPAGLVNGDYDYNFLISSDKKTIVVEKETITHTVTVDGIVRTLQEGATYTFANQTNDIGFIAYTDGENYYDAGDKIVVDSDKEFSTVSIGYVYMQAGASFRISPNVTGIRYITAIQDTDKIKNLPKGAKVEAGTYIAPSEYNVDFTNQNSIKPYDKNPSDFNVVDVKFDLSNNYLNKNSTFAGTIANIKKNNVTKKFVGRGYVKVTIGDYTKTVIAKENNNERSLQYLAYSFKNSPASGYDSLDDSLKAKVDEWAA